jgi:hypothetical protein
MNDLEDILKKLKQPPSVPNWTRYIHDTQEKTTAAVAKFAFTKLQKRLLTTAIDDAILSYGDFSGSHARVICAPRISKIHRTIKSWSTAEYPRLDHMELAGQLGFYSQALVDSVPLITQELERRAVLAAAKAAQSTTAPKDEPKPPKDQGDFFK